MKTINFKVNGQRLSLENGLRGRVLAGTKGYLVAKFTFSEDWDGFQKVAAFYDGDGHEYPRPLVSNQCMVPDEVTDGVKFKVKVFGKQGNSMVFTDTETVRQRVV